MRACTNDTMFSLRKEMMSSCTLLCCFILYPHRLLRANNNSKKNDLGTGVSVTWLTCKMRRKIIVGEKVLFFFLFLRSNREDEVNLGWGTMMLYVARMVPLTYPP